MRKEINFGNERMSINFLDNICYSHVTDLSGNPLDLHMSIMLKNGNSEMRLALGKDDEPDTTKHPLIVWIPGGGYRGCDKNLMVSEMQFFVEAGFVVASIYYRSSAQGHYPDQIIDVKTAIRFLRAHAEEYNINPQKVGVIGRSAGGHLASMAAMNLSGFDSKEWEGYSSEVQAAIDMFGPNDFCALMFEDVKSFGTPGFRWADHTETHAGAVLGVTKDMSREEMFKLAKKASASSFVNEKMAPIQILHGDHDALVNVEISEAFYKLCVEKGLEEQTELYILQGAGHGTREFFQPAVKELMTGFFKKYLGE